MAHILCTEDMQILRVDLVCGAHAEDILRTYLNLRIHLVRTLIMILRTKLVNALCAIDRGDMCNISAAAREFNVPCQCLHHRFHSQSAKSDLQNNDDVL